MKVRPRTLRCAAGVSWLDDRDRVVVVRHDTALVLEGLEAAIWDCWVCGVEPGCLDGLVEIGPGPDSLECAVEELVARLLVAGILEELPWRT